MKINLLLNESLMNLDKGETLKMESKNLELDFLQIFWLAIISENFLNSEKNNQFNEPSQEEYFKNNLKNSLLSICDFSNLSGIKIKSIQKEKEIKENFSLSNPYVDPYKLGLFLYPFLETFLERYFYQPFYEKVSYKEVFQVKGNSFLNEMWESYDPKDEHSFHLNHTYGENHLEIIKEKLKSLTENKGGNTTTILVNLPKEMFHKILVKNFLTNENENNLTNENNLRETKKHEFFEPKVSQGAFYKEEVSLKILSNLKDIDREEFDRFLFREEVTGEFESKESKQKSITLERMFKEPDKGDGFSLKEIFSYTDRFKDHKDFLTVKEGLTKDLYEKENKIKTEDYFFINSKETQVLENFLENTPKRVEFKEGIGFLEKDRISFKFLDFLKHLVIETSPYGEKKAVLKLEPPNLGTLEFEIKVIEKDVTLFVKAENPETLKHLQLGFEQIKSSLQELGLNLKEFQTGLYLEFSYPNLNKKFYTFDEFEKERKDETLEERVREIEDKIKNHRGIYYFIV